MEQAKSNNLGNAASVIEHLDANIQSQWDIQRSEINKLNIELAQIKFEDQVDLVSPDSNFQERLLNRKNEKENSQGISGYLPNNSKNSLHN